MSPYEEMEVYLEWQKEIGRGRKPTFGAFVDAIDKYISKKTYYPCLDTIPFARAFVGN